MGLSLVEAPAEPPVTRAMVKAHLRVEHDEDDTLIDLYIGAETAYAEKFTGRVLIAQTWDYTQDGFPAASDPQEIRIPLGNVLSVLGVFYLDAEGGEQTLDPTNYDVDLTSFQARVALSASGSWPTTYDGLNGVRVRFTAGSEDAGVSPAAPDVLKDIQLAIMLRVQADYDGGEIAKALRDIADTYLGHRSLVLPLG